MASNPSKPCAATTVSIESAITSLDTKEYLIPFVPIEIPSETLMVLKIIDLHPEISAPSAAASANWLICMLHGETMLQVEAIPIWGF